MLNEDKLKEALEQIFDQLDAKGLVPNNVNKDEVITNLLKNLKDLDLNNKDLQNTKTQEKLLISVMSEVVSNKLGILGKEDPKNKLDYKKLFSPELTKDEMKEETKKLLNNLNLSAKLLYSNSEFLKLELKPGTKTLDKEIDEWAEKLAEKLDADEDDELEENISMENVLEALLTETITNLNGGDDPRITGEIQKTILVAVGNHLDAPYQGPVDYNAQTTLADQSRYDAGKYNYNSEEGYAKTLDVAGGLADVCANIFYDSPTLSPPNTKK